jgi:transposase-like protein
VSEISTRDQYDCNDCRYRFSVTSGTIFDNTKLPLWKWFAGIYLMVEGKKGVSANQVKRTLGVTYKTAWFLCHRVREAMRDIESAKLSGIIEIDETWVGGKQRGVGKGMSTNKTAVVGAVERDGKIRLQVVHARDKRTLQGWIRKNVADETEAIYTDDWPSYNGIGDEDTRHEIVNHSRKEWVRGLVHTNSVENIWSLLKRSIVGAFHKVSVKHLERYLDELEFRFNNRHNQHAFRDIMKRLLSKEALRYQKLTA